MNDRITMQPDICHGKPCIQGLRDPVGNVLEWLAGGMSIEDILADYEDQNDHDALRSDPAFKLVCDRLPNDIDLVDQLESWLPGDNVRNGLFAENAAKLYRF